MPYNGGMFRHRQSGRDIRDGTLALVLVFLALSFSTVGQETDAGDETPPNPAGIVLQREHADTFTGGEEVLVTVTINANTTMSLLALGLYETPPAGWTFEGLYVDAGPAPDILPPQGATGVLEFGWVSPQVPVQLRYALRAPPQDSGTRILSGQVEYRLETDPRQNSAPVLTRLRGEANEAPEISLRGPNQLQWPLNRPFTDPGATATDKEDGDLTASIEVAGQVDSNQPGAYTLTYGVIDSAGLRADPVTRTVTVRSENNDTPTTGDPAGDGGAPAAIGSGGIRSPGNMAASPGTGEDGNSGSPPVQIPAITLGKNKPTHQLPPGVGEQGATTPDVVADDNFPADVRMARDIPAGGTDKVPAGPEAGATAAKPPEHSGQESNRFAGGSAILVGGAVLALLAAGVAWAGRWNGAPRRRRD